MYCEQTFRVMYGGGIYSGAGGKCPIFATLASATLTAAVVPLGTWNPAGDDLRRASSGGPGSKETVRRGRFDTIQVPIDYTGLQSTRVPLLCIGRIDVRYLWLRYVRHFVGITWHNV